MPDIVDPATRSRMMSGIRAKNTKPEITLRKALHKRGFRYGLHCKTVPGNPDIVFRAYNAAVFVHGCFWHGHDCRFFRLPSTRQDFWKQKIERNQQRDKVVSDLLRNEGWRQLVVWECALRGKSEQEIERVAMRAEKWLLSDSSIGKLRGS